MKTEQEIREMIRKNELEIERAKSDNDWGLLSTYILVLEERNKLLREILGDDENERERWGNRKIRRINFRFES